MTSQNKRISNYYCETQKTVNTSNKYFSNVVELQENMQPFVRKLLLQLLFLVSAGISRSFDSAMLVTTQIHMQKISQVLLVVYISWKNPNTVKASSM